MRANDLFARVYVHEMQNFRDFLNSQKFRVVKVFDFKVKKTWRKYIKIWFDSQSNRFREFVSHEFYYFSMNTSLRDPVPLRINRVNVDPEIENKSMYLQICFAKKNFLYNIVFQLQISFKLY